MQPLPSPGLQGIPEARATPRPGPLSLRDLRRPHYPNEDVTAEKRVAIFAEKQLPSREGPRYWLCSETDEHSSLRFREATLAATRYT